MGKKRKHNAISQNSNATDRMRFDEHAKNIETDPTTGQKYALPELDDYDSADDLSRDAMAYLRDVRDDAQRVHSMANTSSNRLQDGIETDSNGEYIKSASGNINGGYYDDHSYIAAPFIGPEPPPEDSVDKFDDEDGTYGYDLIEAAEVYHSSLVKRFSKHQARLRRSPPKKVLSALNQRRHPIKIVKTYAMEKELKRWMTRLDKETPRSAQITSMTQDTVLVLMGVAAEKLTRTALVKETDKSGKRLNLKAWIWSLLGRLEDVGSMNGSEISTVRELGKKAAAIVVEFWNEEFGEMDTDEVNNQSVPDTNDSPSFTQPMDVEMDETVISEEGRMEEDDAKQEERKSPGLEENSGEPDRKRRNTNSSFSSAPMDEETGNSSNAGDGDDSEALEKQRTRLLAQIGDSESKENAEDDVIVHDSIGPQGIAEQEKKKEGCEEAFATLDMILTVVGHCYGQKDLLVARDLLWEIGLTEN